MINIKVTMPDNDDIQKQSIEIIKKELNSKLKNVSCPIHHQRPTVIVSGSINNPKYEIQGCCQVLIDEAMKVFN